MEIGEMQVSWLYAYYKHKTTWEFLAEKCKIIFNDNMIRMIK